MDVNTTIIYLSDITLCYIIHIQVVLIFFPVECTCNPIEHVKKKTMHCFKETPEILYLIS